MALQGWSVLMTWQNGVYAINETYIWDGPADKAIDTVYPKALDLMKARTAMMGFGVISVRMRLSLLGAFRTYYNAKPEDIAGMPTGPELVQLKLTDDQKAAGIQPGSDGAADQAKSAIIADFYNNDLSLHSRKFLAGVPDVLIRTDPNGPWVLGVPSWGPLFDKWTGLLTNGGLKWTFNAKPKQNFVALIGISQDPVTSLISVTCATLAPAVNFGDYIQLRGFKMTSRAYISPNGTWQVANVAAGNQPGTTQYLLRGTAQISINQIAKVGTVNVTASGQTPFSLIQLGKQTERKRGNRSLASPGRRTKPAKVFA